MIESSLFAVAGRFRRTQDALRMKRSGDLSAHAHARQQGNCRRLWRYGLEEGGRQAARPPSWLCFNRRSVRRLLFQYGDVVDDLRHAGDLLDLRCGRSLPSGSRRPLPVQIYNVIDRLDLDRIGSSEDRRLIQPFLDLRCDRRIVTRQPAESHFPSVAHPSRVPARV